MSDLSDDILQKLDKVMGELQNMQEEFTLQMGKYEKIGELEERVELLEEKINKLEQPTS